MANLIDRVFSTTNGAMTFTSLTSPTLTGVTDLTLGSFTLGQTNIRSTGSLGLAGYVADGPTAYNVVVDSVTTHADAGARLLAVKNNGNLVAGVNSFGTYLSESGLTCKGAIYTLGHTAPNQTTGTAAGTNDAGGGSLTAGTYHYRYSYTYLDGSESTTSPNMGTGITAGSNTQNLLTNITTSPSSSCTGRKIYRSKDGAAGPYYLAGTIGNNTATTFTDSAAWNTTTAETIYGVKFISNAIGPTGEAYRFDTAGTLSGSGRLIGFYHNGVSYGYIQAQGAIYMPQGFTSGADMTSYSGIFKVASNAYSATLKGNVADSGANVGVILDNANPLTTNTKLLSVRNNGTEKFSVSNSGGLYASESIWSIGATFGATNATSVTLRGQAADGATAVGCILNNNAALTTEGAKVASFRNNGTEVAFVGRLGGIGVGRVDSLPTASATYRGVVMFLNGAAASPGPATADSIWCCILGSDKTTYSWVQLG